MREVAGSVGSGKGMLTGPFLPDPPAGLGRGVAAERLDRRDEPRVADQVEQRVEDTGLERWLRW